MIKLTGREFTRLIDAAATRRSIFRNIGLGFGRLIGVMVRRFRLDGGRSRLNPYLPADYRSRVERLCGIANGTEASEPNVGIRQNYTGRI